MGYYLVIILVVLTKLFSCKESENNELFKELISRFKNNSSPLLSFKTELGVPWHSSQYQSLPEVYVQNASIEIAWTNSIRNSGSISGEIVLPFISSSIDSFDINSEKDFSEADNIIKDLNL